MADVTNDNKPLAATFCHADSLSY